MKVFISSKMSGLKNYGYENFFKKEQELRAQGLDVLNPADIGLKYGFDKPYSFYTRHSLQMLLQADIILCFGDYKNSPGARLELAIAKVSGIPVFVESIPKNILDLLLGRVNKVGRA